MKLCFMVFHESYEISLNIVLLKNIYFIFGVGLGSENL